MIVAVDRGETALAAPKGQVVSKIEMMNLSGKRTLSQTISGKSHIDFSQSLTPTGQAIAKLSGQ